MSSIEDTTTSAVSIGVRSAGVTAIERFALRGRADEPADEKMAVVLRSPDASGNADAVSTYIAAAEGFLRGTLSTRDGFVSAALLAGHRGELVLYSQWAMAGDAPATLPEAWSIAPAVEGLERVDGRTYVVDFTAPDAVSVLTRTATPRAHFGVFDMEPERQEELLTRARRVAPESIGTPGLVAVNFHRSLDGERVINLGLWNGFSEFGQLFSRPGFLVGAEYWKGVAGFRPHFFDVVAVVTR